MVGWQEGQSSLGITPPQEVVHLLDLVEKIREKKITDVIAEKKVGGEEHCVPGGLSRCGRRFNEVSLYA